MSYRIGNRVKIVGNESHHFFELGQEVQVTEVVTSKYNNQIKSYRCKAYKEPYTSWRVLEQDMELVEYKEETRPKIKRRKR